MAFKEITNESPHALIFTSATLPNVEEAKKIYGIEFNHVCNFKLEKPHL